MACTVLPPARRLAPFVHYHWVLTITDERRVDYHDDAHRIRELRALTGWTPGEIRRMAENYDTARRRPPRLRSGDSQPE